MRHNVGNSSGIENSTGESLTGDSNPKDNISGFDFFDNVALCIFGLLIVLLLFFIAYSKIKELIVSVENKEKEEQKETLRHIRKKQLDKWESESEIFKKTDEFKEIQKEALDREIGIKPEHRAVWKSAPNVETSKSTHETHPQYYRPNTRDRYKQCRRGF